MRNSYLVSLSSVLCFSSALFAAAPALIIDLDTASTSALTRIYGRGLEDEGTSGLPVTGGFDCDGDGHLDYAFAQMKGDPLGRIDAGEVTLIFGDGTIGGTIDSAVRQSRVLRIAGTQLSETTGDEIWMDDVDGDGLGDLLIGRQNHTPNPNRRGAGALTILFGSPELRTFSESLNYLDLGKLPTDVKTITLWGASAYDRLGIWMRTGDITGDGVSDLIVGADEVDGLGFPVSYNRGAVYIVRGGSYLKEAAPILDLATFGTEGFPDEFKGNE